MGGWCEMRVGGTEGAIGEIVGLYSVEGKTAWGHARTCVGTESFLAQRPPAARLLPAS